MKPTESFINEYATNWFAFEYMIKEDEATQVV